jgi:hypothetical protein
MAVRQRLGADAISIGNFSRSNRKPLAKCLLLTDH